MSADRYLSRLTELQHRSDHQRTTRGKCCVCGTYSGLFQLCPYCRQFQKNPAKANRYTENRDYTGVALAALVLTIVCMPIGAIIGGPAFNHAMRTAIVRGEDPPGLGILKVAFALAITIFSFVVLAAVMMLIAAT